MDEAGIPKIMPKEHDAPEFADFVSQVLNSVARCYRPDDLYVVQIDNWFGHRWRRYPAGIGSLVWRRWFKSLIVPPFHFHRVKSQTHYRCLSSDEPLYGKGRAVKCLHAPYKGNGAIVPIYRPLRHLTTSGICIWYSSGTRNIERGSLMVYRTQDEEECAWYVSLLHHGAWKIELSEGISPQQVKQLAAPDV